MHTQPDLFAPMLARSFHRQGELFDQAAAIDADSDQRCAQCGAHLVRTESGFLCCPRGHGKLLIDSLDDDRERWGQWFEDDTPIPVSESTAAARRIHARRLAE
jgi:hypothetical protein